MTPEKENLEFIMESKLSVNYDINKVGIKRKVYSFFRFWKDSFNLLIIYLRILFKHLEIFYTEENLYLYQLQVKILKKVISKYDKK